MKYEGERKGRERKREKWKEKEGKEREKKDIETGEEEGVYRVYVHSYKVRWEKGRETERE